MTMVDTQAAIKIQRELMSGENICWAGMPDPKVIFHSDDWYVIPFSLLFAAFSIFWEAIVLGYWGSNGRRGEPSMFMAFWGIPLILYSQYFVWGRFLADGWLKRRTYYAVTDRRVLLLREAWSRKFRFTYLESIPEIVREGASTGTLWLGPKLPFTTGRGSGKPSRGISRFKIDSAVPVLTDVDDVNYVYRLIMDLRETARKRLPFRRRFSPTISITDAKLSRSAAYLGPPGSEPAHHLAVEAGSAILPKNF